MRIALVNSFYYRRGGDCVHVLTLERALREAGHDVAVLAMNHPDNLPSVWQSYWVDRAEFSGDLTFSEKLRLFPRSVYYAPSASAMGQLVRDFRPDVVHLHSIEHHLTLACLVAAKQCGVPVVWTLHDYRLVCPATDMLRQGLPCQRCGGGAFWHCVTGRCKQGSVAKSIAAVTESYAARASRVLRRVDCFVAPSRFLADVVLRMGLPASRIEVVPNPVAPDGESLNECSQRNPTVLFVGRLSREKGVAVLLEALARLGDVGLTVVGDGPERARLEEAARSAGLSVDFLGWQAPEAVRRLMSVAAVLAVPSTWYENCPLVVLEAMAAGLPVVASQIGGLTELLDGGRNGYPVAPADSDAWAKSLRQILDHPEEAARRARNAQEAVAASHSVQGCLDRLLDVYAEVSRPRSRRSELQTPG